MDIKGLYYFAHPYTVKDAHGRYVQPAETANFHLCCYRSAQLLMRGYNVYSPIAHTHPIHMACVEFLRNHEHNIWYKLDNMVIDRVQWDGIILAPQWQTSPGCMAERERFVIRKLPVYHYDTVIVTSPILYGKET